MNSDIPRRNYPLLLASQFLSAFGDNFLLAAILSPLTYLLREGLITEQFVSAQNAIFSAVFFIPFLALAPLAGFLNDRMPKTSWLCGGNIIKALGTLIGLTGILLHAGDYNGAMSWQLIGYALVGVGACVYSPAKYGILPEVVSANRLVKANGTVEMLTLIAILGGLACGAVVYDQVRSMVPCYAGAAALYLLGTALNLVMKRTPCDVTCTLAGSFGAFFRTLRSLCVQARLRKILLGCAIFWFAGAALRNNLQGWGLELFHKTGVVNITNEKLALLKGVLVVGIVLGSVLAGQLHKLGELGWARRYGLLMALGILGMGLLQDSFGIVGAIGLLLVTGLFAGLLIVPLNAALQAECDQGSLGKTVAVQNFCDYLGMLLGAGFLGALTHFNLSPAMMCTALAGVLALIMIGLGLRGKPTASTQ